MDRLRDPNEFQLPKVPKWLEDIFATYALRDAPEDFKAKNCEMKHFPLNAGFKALSTHYAGGVVQRLAPNNKEDRLLAYLYLLKCSWILKTLKLTVAFNKEDRGSPYRFAVHEKQKDIHKLIHSTDWAAITDDELKTLLDQDERFAIWPIPPQAPPLRDMNVPDERILTLRQQLDRGVIQENLVLCRGGDTILGIDRMITFESNAKTQLSVRINTHLDHFIPIYATPTKSGSTPAPAAQFSNGNQAGDRVYHMLNEHDIHLFQQAVTEYNVVSDMQRVKWLMPEEKWKGLKTAPHEGTARIQLWRWEKLPVMQDPVPMGGLCKRNSEVDPRSAYTMESKFSGVTASMLKRQVNPTVLSSLEDDDGNEILLIKRQPPPVLMLFTKMRGSNQYTMLHVERMIPPNFFNIAC